MRERGRRNEEQALLPRTRRCPAQPPPRSQSVAPTLSFPRTTPKLVLSAARGFLLSFLPTSPLLLPLTLTLFPHHQRQLTTNPASSLVRRASRLLDPVDSRRDSIDHESLGPSPLSPARPRQRCCPFLSQRQSTASPSHQ